MKIFSYPDELYVGRDIYVIERTERTGNEDAVYKNKVTAIGIFEYHVGFRYTYQSNHPEYVADFDEIGKTVFFTKAEAEAALKREKNNARKAPKIKACPHCGNTNLGVVADGVECLLGPDENDNCAVICSVTSNGCGAMSGWYPTETEAINAWNRRAGND